ncbi:MAG: molybdopterin-guanine dinucleotide biosynthesis protein B [Alphaproteobacteria bacterium]
MKIFGIAGWSGSGKTTLLVQLVPEIIGRGVSLSTIKHAHHSFDIDRPGKDSYEHRQAGATEVLITADARWALMHENRGEPEPTLEQLVSYMTPVDLLLIEGFKAHPHEKIEVYRAANGKPLLCVEDRHVIAVASDAPIAEAQVPVIDLGDITAIADLILKRTGLGAASRGAA